MAAALVFEMYFLAKKPIKMDKMPVTAQMRAKFATNVMAKTSE